MHHVLTTSISVLECPMLHTIQPFFIRSRCSLRTTCLFPVHVIKMSVVLILSSIRTTRKPSILKKQETEHLRKVIPGTENMGDRLA